ncbi:bifunctional nicotinamide-nucleotide adenylyltransferase/Nudix hydroxylase [Pseudaminobacter sp. 19-2017]|uniref:Bifunctional nicotinamide-nucleotide adenylyltransferase/Nudix hydroxylase n=1 Tax=Pseudaminobacter soli (ex Zhang et al. 2022) TaxID=2831468 RepID=A0A942DX25_9HYPH|nr:bifunctional nicotinamide-nucleotide adenylyltransferase/Nudix hydroxylase [Pseudaminobacter soli]MBS3648763.1 bifunctional nicotinamide-nucleotide adenylyltransferase/Nudix hydroxylase [Pseudaminobacter soli]
MRTGVFIGRFQPFHCGHLQIVRESLSQLDKLLILVGSAGAARSTRNPWLFHERVQMISRTLSDEEIGRVEFLPICDYPSDERWIAEVRNSVNENAYGDDIVLVGYSKDQSSFYLKLFPDWGSLDIQSTRRTLDATTIRNAYFSFLKKIDATAMPAEVGQYLNDWVSSDFYWNLHYEHESISRYRRSWEAAPFPPTFITVDAVVVQSGHILLIRRGDYPGKGLLALPGGFIDQYERIRTAAVRELREETEIADGRGRIPPGRLDTYITESKVFDNPYRSTRGRTVTHAFLFRLPDAKPLWRVNGADDAESANWHPVDSLERGEFFEDHFSIIQDMLGL